MALQPTMMIEGRLGMDPELTFTQAGMAVCKFNVAHTARVKKGEEWVDGDTTWYRIVAWRKLGENCASSLHKGDLVIVIAKPRENKWVPEDGVERKTFEFHADHVGVSLTRAEVTITRNPAGDRVGGYPSGPTAPAPALAAVGDDAPIW